MAAEALERAEDTIVNLRLEIARLRADLERLTALLGEGVQIEHSVRIENARLQGIIEFMTEANRQRRPRS